MNEKTDLLELAETLQNRYGAIGKKWEIIKAEKTENGWNLSIKKIAEKKQKSEGQNESN